MAQQNFQDWEPVILRKSDGKPKQVQRAPGAKKLDNLMSDDTAPPTLVGAETGKKIQQARSAKKLTRVQLAKSMNLKESVIAEYELGTAVLDKKLLSRIARALGVPSFL